MNPSRLDHVSFRLDPSDDVAVARADIAPGDHLDDDGRLVTVPAPVPAGHKLAVRGIAEGAPVRKYGQVIGFASRPIEPGDHVHTHNLVFRPFDRDHRTGVDARPTDHVPEAERATFDGYVRADGRVGTRNYLAVLTTVNCSATAARAIARQLETSGVLRQYPGVDGVVALTHTLGCGTAGAGNEGFEVLRRTLTGYAHHPNIAGLLVLGLGCEVNQIRDLVDGWGPAADRPVRTMTVQELGGTRRTVAAGVAALEEMLPAAGALRRVPVPASELILAMECGGSDAWSGVTANPALGAAADLLVRHGGTAVFGETTEIYGAEHLLTRRAVSTEVGDKLLDRIRWWEKQVQADGSSIDNNPSPGNKAGGLTTILEKSLGAVAKGGTTALCDVVRYAEPITGRGLVFMDTPGYDPVNATGMVAGGATVLCFTTGRGSAFGCKPTPSIKLATNTPLYERMRDDMDLDCGPVADGTYTVQEMGRQIFDLILDVASGRRRTASEELGYGDEEFVPWQLSTTL
ncbi:altronate dehydratase family protein [Streptomyces sp. LHD-70]|uniref:UxaA family hydrolase n=1 Tax=Streptomyces sp. LHD-70 TaxID=3072140 RepID=UPI00281063AC|nr:altronate dehydratase family protein [Streptomyces sp. LHD-70]MDQ8703883.1 altronate dehydratase family protein [Streptomyces sp. LHD-70]